MGAKIHPSILCANHGNLTAEVQKLANAGVDYYHIDVMDGSYVPNFGCGTEVVKAVTNATSIPLDVHLMVNNPSRHIQFFHQLGANIITFHPEVDLHPARTLAEIKSLGIIPGIAINPGTSIEAVSELLPLCQHVLVMTVNPGFGGQSFLEYTIDKIAKLGKLAAQQGFSLCVDGNVTPERVHQLTPLGVTNYVIGTAIFNGDYLDVLQRIHS